MSPSFRRFRLKINISGKHYECYNYLPAYCTRAIVWRLPQFKRIYYYNYVQYAPLAGCSPVSLHVAPAWILYARAVQTIRKTERAPKQTKPAVRGGGGVLHYTGCILNPLSRRQRRRRHRH